MKHILERYKSVSDAGIGKLKGMKGKLIIKDGARPKLCKAREVAYTLRLRVEEELDRLQKEELSHPPSSANGQHPLFPYLRQMAK